MIELVDITKRFGGAVAALDGISLTIAEGEVLGLLGENGAGKSTLMNVLFGLVRASSGRIVIAGREVQGMSPRGAIALGIGMVHQHFKLVPTLTVLENLSLFLRGSGRILRAEMEGLLSRLKWELPLKQRVESLTVGQQQRVEIVKALVGMERVKRRTGGGDGGTLILDEPTAVLTPQESEELFDAVRALRDAGTGVVFISHKLGEVRALCDRVAILRRGRLVYEGAARGESALNAEQMAEKMVGSAVSVPRISGHGTTAGPVVLEVSDVTGGMLREVSLQVRAGEIVGIAGVDGNGQSSLARVLLGVERASQGRVLIEGEEIDGVRKRVEKMAWIAEDRQTEALAMPLSVQDNLMLKAYRREGFSIMGWLRFGAWRRESRRLLRQFDIRASGVMQTVGRLSGGNQQKVVLARELGRALQKVVVAINPTRGLDVGATAFVMEKLIEARGRGAGVLLIHSDLDELLGVSDRILVMYGGRLLESGFPKAGKEEIGRLMLGVTG